MNESERPQSPSVKNKLAPNIALIVVGALMVLVLRATTDWNTLLRLVVAGLSAATAAAIVSWWISRGGDQSR